MFPANGFQPSRHGQSWYDTALIKSTELTAAISANTQQNRFKQAMNACNIIS